MNIIAAKFKRDRIITLLLTVLLISAVAFGCLGFSSWFGVQQQIASMEEQYTTVAIPVKDFNWSMLYSEEHQKSVPLSQHSEYSLPGYLSEDCRCLLSAYVKGTQRLSALEFNVPNYFSAFDMSSTQFTVLAARCDSIDPEIEFPMLEAIFDENNDISGYKEYTTCSYQAKLTVLDTICRSEAYKKYPIEVVRVSSPYTSDRQIPFQIGQTYLLFGYCGEFGTRISIIDDEPILKIEPSLTTELSLCNTFAEFGSQYDYMFSTEQQLVDGRVYECLMPGSVPFYAAYHGSWKEFLQSEDGTVWRDTIVPFCEASYATAGLLLTNNIDSILPFSNNNTTILEGRKISKEEYKTGADVCLVSAAYAKQNNLSVGDSLNLELFNSPLSSKEVFVHCGFGGYTDRINLQAPLRKEDQLDINKDYTIVGIYTGPEFQPGCQYFDANTIIVPKASVPDSSRLERLDKHLLYSVILENGREEEFEAALAELGFGGMFEYFNQGYGAAATSLRAAQDNALRLLLSSAGVFLLASALYLFFVFKRIAPTLRSMRLLGVKPQQVCRQVFQTTGGLIVLSVLLGGGLGAILFRTISSRILSEQITLYPLSFLLCIAGQLILLLSAEYIWSRIAANQNLMQRK